jgi:hypothetical protein
MSKTAYLEDLTRRIENLEFRMAKDRRQLAEGEPRAKVEAAGDLAVLEQRLSEARQKLSRLEAEPAGEWENIKSELEEEFDHLEVAFERWAARQ